MPLLLSTVEIDLLQLTVESLLANALGDDSSWGAHVAAMLGRLVGGEKALLAMGAGSTRRLYGPAATDAECRALLQHALPTAADVTGGRTPSCGSRVVSAENAARSAGAAGSSTAPDDGRLVASMWLVDPNCGVEACFVARLAPPQTESTLHRARAVLEIVRPAFAAAVRIHHTSQFAPAVETGTMEQRSQTVAATLRDRYGLTARETDVAALLLQGRANAEIACTLRISPSTARHHTERVLDKLGVRSRAEVAGLAFEQLGTPPFGSASVRTPPVGIPAVAAVPRAKPDRPREQR